MNILVVTDDGPDSYGLEVLRASIKRAVPHQRVVTLTTDRPLSGQGMSVRTCTLEEVEVKRVKPDFYVCTCKPIDLIYLAFYHPDRFLSQGAFDLVVSGVNYGHNVGLDVFHSGTVGMVMFASTVFGATGIAFSQMMDSIHPKSHEDDRVSFPYADKLVQTFMEMKKAEPGSCWNVNFPLGDPKGWKMVEVAPYSRFRKNPMLALGMPGYKTINTDIHELGQGFVTVSELDLRVNPTLRY